MHQEITHMKTVYQNTKSQIRSLSNLDREVHWLLTLDLIVIAVALGLGVGVML